MYTIDPNTHDSLHIQLYKALKNDISTNYTVGDKLPSIRRLASTYNLSKTTVESAYSQLYAEGYIESYPKRGYFVSDVYFDTFKPKEVSKISSKETKTTYKYDFFPAQLAKESFPLKLWKRLFTKAIDASLDFGAYTDGQGEVGLRIEIAKYLSASRGVNCLPEQIVVTCGFGESMGLLAKLVKDKYTHFAMEHPGYHVARKVYEEYGYKIEKIPVDTKGLQLEQLKRSKAKIVYITPSHQYPTGVAMPITNRLKLLEYIQSVDGLIIEDDYDSELSYYNRPIPSLQGLDKNDCVVYMGTFSKSLSPALRISYLVLPYHLIPRYKESFNAHFSSVSLSTQKTLQLFMSEGHWERHIRKVRMLNKKKHNLMKERLKKELGSTMKILSQGGGLAILIHPTLPFDFEKFKILAEEESIKIYLAKERSGGDFEAVRMGFGCLSEEDIIQGVHLFSKIWNASIL